MLKKIPKWSEEDTRKAHLDTYIANKKTSFFGFKKVPTDDKAKKVREHFNRVAQRYDIMNTILSLGLHYMWKREAIRRLKLKPGDRIIDVCGGTGDLSILAAKEIGKIGSIIVYDINRPMMQMGVLKVNHTPYKHQIRFVQGDAERISFPAEYFNAAFVGFGIRNVSRMEKGFEEMYRVLKPGGKLMCLEFSKPTNPFFCRLYDLYSFYYMPFIGSVIVGSGKPYGCLSETIRMFLLPDELTAVLKHIGFSHVSYRKLTNGIAAIHFGIKP